jgi:hypothetical protein
MDQFARRVLKLMASSEATIMYTARSRHVIRLGASLLALAICASAGAEENKVKEAAKEVGHSIGSAAREVGHETKHIAKEVSKAVSEAARETGHAFRDGAKEVKKAATSDTEKAKPAGPKK